MHEKLTEEEGIPIPYSTLTRLLRELGLSKEPSTRCGRVPDEPGAEMVYHVVSVTQGRANFVNLMRVAGWEKSAVNIDVSHRLGVGIDLHKTESEARQWLLSWEGEALRDAVAALRVGVGWREYLKQVK